MNLESAKKTFLEYTKPYEELDFMCSLKIHHTFRVMNLCREIALSLDLDKEDIEFAELCGLLHDIGRFEQWKRYQTFSDEDSIDHAELGVHILQENQFLDKFMTDSSMQSILLNSIYYHNKYEIDNSLEEKDKLFCNIVRDADKIDILYLCSIGHIKRDIENDFFSDKIYSDLLNKRQINRRDIKTKGDNLSVSLGLVYGINYDKSLEIIKEKDYINQIIRIYQNLTHNEIMKEQLEEVKNKIYDYLKGEKRHVR